MLAGYVHQTINIIRNVGDRHITMDAFVPLRKIAYDPAYKKVRGYAQMIRNETAFHLDENEHENTRSVIDKLDPTMYVLMGADSANLATFISSLPITSTMPSSARPFKLAERPKKRSTTFKTR